MFTVIALVSMLNLAVLAGFAGFAWCKGWLERERVREAVAILVSEEPTGEAADVESADAAPSNKPAPPAAPGAEVQERIRRSQEREEQRRIEFERRERDIKNLWALLETRELALMRAKEELAAEQERFQSEREQLARQEGDSGLQMEVETIAGIDPKSAKELLKLKDDEDAARILKVMDDRNRNKIVKQCKNSEERLWIGRILEKFHGNANQAEALDAAP